MRRAFADEDGLCRISSWLHHAIRPAQPNSLRSHFLCLRLRSSQRAWFFLRALRPRQWTSYLHSSTSSRHPSPSSAAQVFFFFFFRRPSSSSNPYLSCPSNASSFV